MRSSPELIPDLLAASAERDPEASAVEGGSEAWSYARLDDAAWRLAGAMRGQGVRPGDRVCLCARKSPETLAALFGILRAGAVFVPLDRTSPPARLAGIASDCGAHALIGAGARFEALRVALCGDRGLRLIVDLEAEEALPDREAAPGLPLLSWGEAMAAPLERIGSSRSPADPAYLLYTSGSTGAPKGVVISHRNALAFTSWACRRFGIGRGDRVTSVAPLHFDLSTFDLYSTLEGGATVLLVPEETALFPASLAAYLEASQATVTYLVPSALTGMLLHGSLETRSLGRLRLILFAGEVFPAAHLSRLIGALPGAGLFNLYGPTETNVCTYYEVKPEDLDRAAPVPIGIDASGDVSFALNDAGDLVRGEGEEGELHVAGPTVAIGYWGDPGKASRQFIDSHPLAPSGARVYRTGDRVSLDGSGQWLFHGRRDHMVKSRGFRIELGEIESALHAHAAVAEAVAIAIPDPEVGSRIKACIVLRPGCEADGPAIQRHCSERLARYMVPEFVEILGTFPRTSSGKVDRMKLSGPPASRS